MRDINDLHVTIEKLLITRDSTTITMESMVTSGQLIDEFGIAWPESDDEEGIVQKLSLKGSGEHGSGRCELVLSNGESGRVFFTTTASVDTVDVSRKKSLMYLAFKLRVDPALSGHFAELVRGVVGGVVAHITWLQAELDFKTPAVILELRHDLARTRDGDHSLLRDNWLKRLQTLADSPELGPLALKELVRAVGLYPMQPFFVELRDCCRILLDDAQLGHRLWKPTFSAVLNKRQIAAFWAANRALEDALAGVTADATDDTTETADMAAAA